MNTVPSEPLWRLFFYLVFGVQDVPSPLDYVLPLVVVSGLCGAAVGRRVRGGLRQLGAALGRRGGAGVGDHHT